MNGGVPCADLLCAEDKQVATEAAPTDVPETPRERPADMPDVRATLGAVDVDRGKGTFNVTMSVAGHDRPSSAGWSR